MNNNNDLNNVFKNLTSLTEKEHRLHFTMMNDTWSNHSDDPKYHKFNSSIKFVVEEYIENDCPITHKCTDMDDMIKKAYTLFLKDKLHSVGIYDRNRIYNGSGALNNWRTETNTSLENELEELKKENEIYKEFLKKYKAEETYKEFKKNRGE